MICGLPPASTNNHPLLFIPFTALDWLNYLWERGKTGGSQPNSNDCKISRCSLLFLSFGISIHDMSWIKIYLSSLGLGAGTCATSRNLDKTIDKANSLIW